MTLQNEAVLKKVIDNVKVFQKLYPKTIIRLNITITSYNSSEDDILSIIDFGKTIGASLKFVELYPNTHYDFVFIEQIGNILSKNNFFVTGKNDYRKVEFSDGVTNVYLTRCSCSEAIRSGHPRSYCKDSLDILITPDGKISTCIASGQTHDVYELIKRKDEEALGKEMDYVLENLANDCIYEEPRIY
jgi:molybdenum cofactor biosynthesis enzyme MoaA